MKEDKYVLKTRSLISGMAGMLAAALLALCIVAPPVWAAERVVSDADDLQSILESGVSPGDTVSIDSNVTDVDLSGVGIKVGAGNITLRGQANHDLGAAIKTEAGSLAQKVYSARGRVGLGSLFERASDLSDTLQARVPTTNIMNSAAATGTHAGISAPLGGFSLQNMTLKGTTANMDSASGASKYMGLIASTFDRSEDPLDGQGMGLISNVAFIDNVVHSTGAVHNVGNALFFTQRRYDATGAFNNINRIETLEGIVGSVFIGNKMYADMTASVGNRDVGGAGAGWVNLLRVESSIFMDNYVQGHHAFGGALYAYSLGTISDSMFVGNIVASDHDAYGGAIMTNEGIDRITRSVFVGNEAQGLEYGLGRAAAASGGAIHTGGNPKGIGLIADSLFAYNRAYNETGEEAIGGAVTVGRVLGNITRSVFLGNMAESTTDAFGGAMAVNVNTAGMVTTITDSLFMDNSVVSAGVGAGGALSIGLVTAAVPIYVLNLETSVGGLTEFSGNTVNGAANSIYFGANAATGTTETDVTLNINARQDGVVALQDPLRVDLNNGKTFTMVNSSAGTFMWNGINDLNADGGSSLLFRNGSNTLFGPGLHVHGGSPITLDLDNGANLTVNLTGRNPNMAVMEDVDVINSNGATLSGVYLSFEDAQGSWRLFEHGTAPQGTNIAVVTTEDLKNGTRTEISLNTIGNDTWVNLNYRGPNAAFAAASPNAVRGRDALQDYWMNVAIPNLNAAQQSEYFTQILGDLNSYTAEAFATQGLVALNSSYWISSQAMRSDRRSWYATRAYCSAASEDLGGKFRFWSEYIGNYTSQHRDNGYSGYDFTSNGVIVGASYDFGRTAAAGIYFAYANGDTDYDDINADIDTDTIQVGLFASFKSDFGFGATLDASYAWMDNDTDRSFMGRNYEGSFDQEVFGLGLKVDYGFSPWENGCLSPFIALRYQHLEQDSFKERGFDYFPLHVGSTDADSFSTSLGLNLDHRFEFESAVFTPQLSLAWRHEYGDRDILTGYNIAGQSINTSARSVKQSADSLDVGASFTLLPITSGKVDLGLNAGYFASFGADREEHTFYGGLELKF